MNILVINPGGTSTKISVFENENEIFKKSIKHTQEDLNNFETVFDQYKYRKNLILNTLSENGFQMSNFDCVVGRGGLMKAISGGTYKVNEKRGNSYERNSICRSRWTRSTYVRIIN